MQLHANEAKNKNNKNKWKPDWTALALWQKETLSRQVKQAKGEIKTNTAGSPPGNSVFSPVTSVLQSGSSLYPNLQQLASIHKLNMDLDCPACPPAYVRQAQAAASAPPLQAPDSTSEQQRGPTAGPAPSTASGSPVSYSSKTGTITDAFQPDADQEHGEGRPRDGKHVSRLACEQHRRLKDLPVYALHREELELAKEQKEKKKLRLAQLQAYQGNQGGQQRQQRGRGKGKGRGGRRQGPGQGP